MSHALEKAGMLLALSVWTAHAALSSPAARIDGEEITTAAVDAISIEQAQRIRQRLTHVARRALEELIDVRLGIHEMPPPRRFERRSELYRAHGVTLMPIEPGLLENALPGDRIVAVIDGEPMLASALEQVAALRLYRLRGELYLQRRRDLDRLIERRLLELEAASRGASLLALEDALSEVDPVTDAEVDAFVSRERAAGRVVENPGRVRPYLEFQKRHRQRASVLKARRAKTQIRIELRPPPRPRLAMDTRAGVKFGPSGGRTLVAYTNYVCALCRATHAELDRLLSAPDPPHIVLHDFAYDPAAVQAAALVCCAARNGRAAAMRRYLLRRQPPRTDESWVSAQELKSLASIVGVKPSLLRECIDSPEIRERIEADTRSALHLGFDAPPAFIAEGVPLSGMQSASELGEALSGRADSML